MSSLAMSSSSVQEQLDIIKEALNKAGNLRPNSNEEYFENIAYERLARCEAELKIRLQNALLIEGVNNG